MEKLAQDLDGNLLHSSIARHDNLEKDPMTPIATAVKLKTENTQVHSGEGCHEEAIGENSKGTNRKSLDLVSLKSEDYDTDLDDIETDTTRAELARKEDVDIGHLTYAEACKQLEISPRRVIIQQLRSRDISLQHIGLKTNDAIALSQALMANNRVESIDMEDNGLTEEAIVHLLEALKLNIHISNLCFSENKFNLNSAMKMGEYMHEATYLTHLDLSGTRLGNMGAKQIAYGIRGNVSLVGLNLKNNEIGEVGSQHLGSALSINDTLEVLNLGWNHIRRMGAVAFCRSLQKNTSLVTLDLSWNGLGFEGSICLEEVLKKNKTLKVLDISHNRINWEGIVYLARGLRQNSSLQILKIGNNPISMDGCEKLLRSLNTPISHVIHVGLEDIPVNTGVLNVTRTIGLNRIFSISHGGVLDTKDIMGIRKEKRDDPLSLLIRYLSVMGIRVVDLFRMFESDSHAHVSKESFIKGLKKIGTPLSDRDMRVVARRLDKRGEGFISYSLLANGVRNQIKNERKEDRKQLLLEVKRREERKRILRHGVTGPRNAHLPDVNEMIPPRDSYSRLLSASNTSIGQISSSSRVGFLPRLPEADSNTPRNLVTMQKGNSVYMPTEKTKTPSSSTSAIASNTIESVETQLEKLSYPLKSENSSPVPSQ